MKGELGDGITTTELEEDDETEGDDKSGKSEDDEEEQGNFFEGFDLEGWEEDFWGFDEDDDDDFDGRVLELAATWVEDFERVTRCVAS